jgi:hypothetical protein
MEDTSAITCSLLPTSTGGNGYLYGNSGQIRLEGKRKKGMLKLLNNLYGQKQAVGICFLPTV